MAAKFLVENGARLKLDPLAKASFLDKVRSYGNGELMSLVTEVMSRDAEGRATIRAIRLDEPLQVDGKLDESVYQTIKPVTGFYQVLPDAGKAATEDTDIWVMFDRENVYVGARLWQKDMARTLVANEMRRDKARQELVDPLPRDAQLMRQALLGCLNPGVEQGTTTRPIELEGEEPEQLCGAITG